MKTNMHNMQKMCKNVHKMSNMQKCTKGQTNMPHLQYAKFANKNMQKYVKHAKLWQQQNMHPGLFLMSGSTDSEHGLSSQPGNITVIWILLRLTEILEIPWPRFGGSVLGS